MDGKGMVLRKKVKSEKVNFGKRRAFTLSVLFAALIFAIVSIGCASADLNEGLVAYYPFNGNANDVSGNGNHGTVHNASLTTDRFGNANSAYGFDGVDDYVETTLESSGKTKTLTAWIHPKSSDVVSYIENVIDSDVPGQYGTGWGLNNGYIKVMADNLFWSTSQPVILDQWQHVSVTYSPTELKLYYNGELVDNKIYTQGSITVANYKIGKSNANPLYFHGFIDEVRIYNRALTETEIKELYNLYDGGDVVTPKKGPVGYWKFDEGSGTRAYDSSGNGNDGTIHGATWVDGRCRKALSFDGGGAIM